MLVIELLKESQDKCLVGVPAGVAVIETAEILLGHDLPQSITGKELQGLLEQLEVSQRDRFLNHSLDDTMNAYKNWTQLTETKKFRSSVRILDLTVTCVILLSAITGGMFAFEYYKTGVLPVYEQLAVTFLPLSMALAVQYCLNDAAILAFVFKLISRRKGN